ncbi:MAG: hypothetical protein IK038_09755 [Bacteroidaceae bacterium]|nr:hypothetical protein [Bacteroidaceae bacterium]
MRDPVFASQQKIIKKINNCEVNNFLVLDWELYTNCYQPDYLQRLIFCVKAPESQIAAVKACLECYRLYLIKKDFIFYKERWENGCAFKDFCEALLRNLEQRDEFTIKNQMSVDATNEGKKSTSILDTEKAKELLSRLPHELYDGGQWVEGVTKAFKSQTAHVIGKLLGIPSRKKWKDFEECWHLKRMSKSFYSLNERALDPLLIKIYPEYNSIIYKV